MKIIKKRNEIIDIMRLLWLILIILAHTISPNTLLFQLRNFDVPMMVIISWMSFYLSRADKEKLNLKSYYKKRILNLILPTWVFLSFFFIFSYFINYFSWNIFPFDWKILWSFLLFQWEQSIWYVWIIRVFLLVALINPLLLYIFKKVNIKIFTLLIFIFYIFYEICVNYFPFWWNSFLNIFMHQYIYYLIPYSLLSATWIVLINIKQKYRYIFIFLFSILIVLFINIKYWFWNVKFFPQDFKYPATSLYLFWWIFVTFLITTIFNKIYLNNFFKNILQFLSKYSLWLYFWHIFVINFIIIYFNLEKWFYYFFIVLWTSLLILLIHNLFFTKILKIVKNNNLKKYIEIIFLK